MPYFWICTCHEGLIRKKICLLKLSKVFEGLYFYYCNSNFPSLNTDQCQSTSAWVTGTRPSLTCHDLCPSRGPLFKGNIADPDEKRHYVACWYGVTAGCVDCPGGLYFNEKEQACLYQGQYFTKPAST